jgi:peptidoglycan hydrolase-like protein with peptidoglycan-binding domain
MSIHKFSITATLLTLVLMAVAASATTSTKHTTSKHTTSKHASTSHHASTHKTSAHPTKYSSKKTVAAHSHGQRTIGEERTREIQSALIREHFMNGEPSGVWDAESKDAMVRYQQANGWQTKVTPDSRALIKLGLGPDHKDLLNPDTAVVASPHELGTMKDAVPGGSAQ